MEAGDQNRTRTISLGSGAFTAAKGADLGAPWWSTTTAVDPSLPRRLAPKPAIKPQPAVVRSDPGLWVHPDSAASRSAVDPWELFGLGGRRWDAHRPALGAGPR